MPTLRFGELGGTDTRLFFTTGTKDADTELWNCKATVEPHGLKPVRVEGFPTTSCERMTSGYVAISESVYFTSADKDWRYLYRSDGTTAQSVWSSEKDEATHLVNVAGTLFFVVNGEQVWRVVGDTAKLVAKLEATTGDSIAVRKVESLERGPLFLACKLRLSERWELWVADETGARRLVSDLIWEHVHLSIMQNKLCFTAQSSAGAADLWRSDGTPRGTNKLVTLEGKPRGFVAMRGPAGDVLFFTAVQAGKRKLFKIHGSDLEVTQVNAEIGGRIRTAFAGEDRVLFLVERKKKKWSIWSSKGREKGTKEKWTSSLRGSFKTISEDLVGGRWWLAFEPKDHFAQLEELEGNRRGARMQTIHQIHVVNQEVFVHGVARGRVGLWRLDSWGLTPVLGPAFPCVGHA